MSYHILQQFDVPWFAEARQTTAVRPRSVFEPASTASQKTERSRPAPRSPLALRLVVLASLLVAAAALLFALDARQRADRLQERLTALENRK